MKLQAICDSRRRPRSLVLTAGPISGDHHSRHHHLPDMINGFWTWVGLIVQVSCIVGFL